METTTDSVNRSETQSQNEEEILCVVCDQKLKRSDIAQHTANEMEQLLQSKSTVVAAAAKPSNKETQQTSDGRSNNGERKPWSVFKKVQKNRQSRLKQRTRKRVAPAVSDQACPVCNENFTPSELQSHVEQCLRRSNGNGPDANSSSSDDEYEEYEWAGQKRIRTSSLLQGGYAAIGVGSNNTSAVQESEDEDLNVDEDDTRIYGPPQYNEGDVIALESERNGTDREYAVTNYVRRLITGNTNEANCSSTLNLDANANDNNRLIPHQHSSTKDDSDQQSLPNKDMLIDSLKVKLDQFANQAQNKYKCLICLDDYRNPAVSVSCWHVYCEQCWLQTLGARKLCPQCNLITTPKDLRRIYM